MFPGLTSRWMTPRAVGVLQTPRHLGQDGELLLQGQHLWGVFQEG